MAGRIRSIKPEILDDEVATDLSDTAWRLWVSSWLLADDHGRFRAAPRYLAAEVWQDTRRIADAAAALDELARARLVRRYDVEGQAYAEIKPSGWKRHQRIDHPGAPRVPVPDAASYLDAEDRDRRGRRPSAAVEPVEIAQVDSNNPAELRAVPREPSDDSPRPSETLAPRARALDLRSPISDLRSPTSDQEVDRRNQADGPTGPSTPSAATSSTDDTGTSLPLLPLGPPTAKATKATKRKPATPAPTRDDLTPAEQVVHDAIADDADLARICRTVPTLARDLVRAAPSVDIVREVHALGAWLRANPARAKVNGNAFLVRCIGRKQQEAGDRSPPVVAEPPPDRQPPPPPRAPPAVEAERARLRAARAAGEATGAPPNVADLLARVGRSTTVQPRGGSTP